MTLSIPLFPMSISINDKNRQKSTKIDMPKIKASFFYANIILTLLIKN